MEASTMELFVAFAAIALAVVFDVAAFTRGADSRDGIGDDHRR
jgi:hypothetical protein